MTETIAFVSDAVLPFNKGGKETRLYEISRRLVKEGREVRIYTMKWWDGPDRLLVEGVWLHALCRKMPLYAGNRRSIKEAVVFGLSTLKLMRERFDVLDVDHMPFFPVFSARLVCLLKRRAMFATWHEVWGKAYWREYLGRLGLGAYVIEALAVHTPARMIVDSRLTTERVIAMRPNVKLDTVPAGVDLELCSSAPPAALNSDLIFTGRLLSHKNIDLLLEAVARLVAGRPELSCLIVGEGPERARLEELAGELGISSNVRFFDFFPDHADVFGLMKASRVFVLPSEREGFGLVVLEANVCGVPVVTVRHPDNAATELVDEGRNGVLAELNEVDLADKIAFCLESPLPGIADRLAEYDWATIARRIEQILLPESARVPVEAGTV